MMVIHVAGSEGSERFAVEAVRRSRAGLDDVALVELESDFACHILLCGFCKCNQCVAKRRIPFALIDDLSKLVAYGLLEFHCSPVEDELLELLVSLHEDRAARCLIDAAGLHADNTVLNDVNDADAVLAAELVQRADDISDLHLLAVDGCRDTLFECHCDLGLLVRSFLRGDGEDEHVLIIRSQGRIFELETFVADVPQVAVTAVALGVVERKINAVGFAVRNLVVAGLHCPEICHTPRGDNFDIRSQSFDAQLEADLIVALAGCAMADRDSAFLARDLDQLLYDSGAGHGCAEQVFVLIDSARLYAGHDEVLSKIIIDVLDI